MSNVKRTFSTKGLLRGMGFEGACLVLGNVVTSPAGHKSMVPKLSIHNEPRDLPDGVYEVCFCGRVQPMRHKGNCWITL